MPGILNQAGAQLCNAPATAAGSGGGIWARHRDITFGQLQKFWSELPPRARQELLRIDKQTLFEQARKNLYCSRCNGLLLEGFSQIVMYGKSLQQEGDAGVRLSYRIGASETQNDEKVNDVQDPSVHPWGGLAATRDGILTLLDSFINEKSLKSLQNVFDSARARERERELLYPDACGGGGRGWISQGLTNYGRGHGTRETCALHTARLSCDTLVDFWSALSDETRLSLLRMKEEDFVERLMYRFDSKRFCRDCRRNVIREFKELKELKRMRRETRCTSWFCVADTAFQYELSEDMVQADWHQSFTDTDGTYHHFEWAIGSGEGKSDILDFEDVGMNGNVEVDGLDLGGLNACFITLRAWKLDGRCTELSVKAHALKGQSCVHHRLVVGDGFVTITKGEGIRRFFEHAEEAEEEEDDDAMDKDGNDFDGDGSRPRKHAKSPELAREFLLDAATVIFKEQVEKAFREGTARQNAHSIFVCLALKLLEERVHVACKEIITLEKQFKLLEEEEREKREEVERKERRRTKEREKKLRRKERIKGKEREREIKQRESHSLNFDTRTSVNDSPTSIHDESQNSHDSGGSVSDSGDNIMPDKPMCTDITDEQSSNGCIDAEGVTNDTLQHQCHVLGEVNSRDCSGTFTLEQSKSSRRKMRFRKDYPLDQVSKWYDKRQPIISNEVSLQHDEYEVHRRGNVVNNSARSCGNKFNERFHSSNSRIRYDFHSCTCNQNVDYRKGVNGACAIRRCKDMKASNKKESSFDMPRPLYRSSNGVIPKGKHIGTPSLHMKQVWEPMDARKKCTRSSSDPDISLRSASKINSSREHRIESDEDKCRQQCNLPSVDHCSSELSDDLTKVGSLDICQIYDDKNNHEDSRKISSKYSAVTKSDYLLKNGAMEEVGSCPTISTITASNVCDPMMSSSSSDNCSSCLSEGDSSTGSSSTQNAESSSTSDSEDASPQSDGRTISTCNRNSLHIFCDDSSDSKHKANEEGACTTRTSVGSMVGCIGDSFPCEDPARAIQTYDNGGFKFDMARQQPHMLPVPNQSMHVPIFSSPPGKYHDQSSVSWSAAPANGFMPFPQKNHYVFPSPLGYGLTANQPSDYCMQFSAVQPHLVFNMQQHPMYQTTNRVIVATTKEQTQNPKVSGAQHANGAVEAMGRPFSSKQLSSKPSSAGKNACVENSDRVHTDSSSFSLFHFGGPVAGAAVNSLSLNGNAGGLTSTSPPVEGDLAHSKEEMEIEEYSLFATNNGSRFSFF